MFLLLFILLLFICSTIIPETSASNKTLNRLGALWNLNAMSECKLHYTAIVYDDYGCWCGIGGSGTPIDGIDVCCRAHDKCYDAAVDNSICYDTLIEYADPYKWNCTSDEPQCPEPDQQVGCKEALCECDKHVVDCWSNFKKPAKREKCTHRLSPIEDHSADGGIFHRLLNFLGNNFIFFFPTN